VHEPQSYEAPEVGSPAEIGQEIGRKALLLFPGGVLVDEEPWQHGQAAARTKRLMEDANVPAIFEAAVEADNIRIRVDVLERLNEDRWGLREVKSSSCPKDHHYDDIALQAYVLQRAGVRISSIELIHVNTAYVRGPNGIAWTDFFVRADVGEAVAAKLSELPSRLPAMRDCLALDVQPDAEPGSQCGTPYGCEFWDRCIADKPADWINYLPRLSLANVDQLKAMGIEAISNIPADFPLSSKQTVIRDATSSGQPYIADDLARLLAPFGPPAYYLDFEAMMPPIPLYEGTRPYQTLPFQWSLHWISGNGELEHNEFLADGTDDPRRAFAESLIDALGRSEGPIIVYSAYERTTLRALAAIFPHLEAALNALIARLADLLPVVRGAVYLPEFGFSNSIKAVAPALCPSFRYDDLDGVADGIAASGAFLQLASGLITAPEEIASLRAQLLAYCKKDTLAMVEVHRALLRLSAQN